MTEPEESKASYPRTTTTRQGLPVDEGIAPLVERVIDFGLTPRSSCSGLGRDHASDATGVTPYLSIQVAPTFETARPTTSLPDAARDSRLLARLQDVGDRADWEVGTGVSWMLYPTVTFRVVPTRGDLKDKMYGHDREFDDLSDDEEARLDQRYEDVQAELDALSDAAIDAKWDALLEAIATEFDEDEEVPQFADNKEAFEAAQEDWPKVFEVFFDSEDELLKFYGSE